MSMPARHLAAIAAVGAAALGFAAGEPAPTNAPRPLESIRVIDLLMVSSNRVAFGTNTMSLADATNLIARYRSTVDIVAIHGAIEGDAGARKTASAMSSIARVGVPLVIVETDGHYAWREPTGAGGVRTVKLGTDQFTALRRFWGKDEATPSRGPALRTTIDWDAGTGAYELSRVELGLFGRHVWLMHEQRHSPEASGAIGIQLKKEW